MKNLTFGKLKGRGWGGTSIPKSRLQNGGIKTLAGGGGGVNPPEGRRNPISKDPYRTVVPTYTEYFSTLAQLESV